MEKQNLVSVEYVVPEDIQEQIAEKISKDVREAYYYNVSKAVSERIIGALTEDGFMGRVADAVVQKITISEDEFISGISEQVKDALLETTGVISREVLKKVNEKVQSYGFIQIGR